MAVADSDMDAAFQCRELESARTAGPAGIDLDLPVAAADAALVTQAIHHRAYVLTVDRDVQARTRGVAAAGPLAVDVDRLLGRAQLQLIDLHTSCQLLGTQFRIAEAGVAETQIVD